MTVPLRVSLLGCGWLGLPLASFLMRSGYAVRGSTTTPAKLDQLKSLGIDPSLINFNPLFKGPTLKAFLEADILFINIPFKRDLIDSLLYKQEIHAITQAVKESSIKFVILASSTSIYPTSVFDAREEAAFVPDNPRSKILYEVEQALLEERAFDATIVRLAGLYGEGRPVGKFLSGKKDIEGAGHPVNLIHQEDAVAMISGIIKNDLRKEIFNICSDAHPTRLELYTKSAHLAGLPPPEFKNPSQGRGKIVCNRKIKQYLNYQCKHPDPLNL